MKEVIKVIVTDDKELFRRGLMAILQDEGIVTIGEAANGAELLKILESRGVKPDVILLDLEMPVMDGNKTLVQLKEKHPDIKVIIITSFSHYALMEHYLEKGADAYLDKNVSSDVLCDTIRQVFYLKDYKQQLERAIRTFSEPEIEALPYIIKGKSSKEIADILHKSPRTIEAIRNNLYLKTNTKNVADFSRFCGQQGFGFLIDNNPDEDEF